MSEHLPADVRRYGDREIAKILKRASQMQRESPARPDPSGLTLAELEEIAAEAGIDVENLRLAAAEVATQPENSLETRVLGAPLTQRLQRAIPGELPTEAFGSLVPLLQVESGTTGQASTVGRTLTWASTSSGNSARTLNVLVIAENGETRIQLEERSSQAAIGFHVGFGSGGLGFALPAGLALGATGGVGLGIAAGVGIGGAFYMLGRTLYKLTTNHRRRKVEVMFERLAERIADLIAQHTLAGVADPAALPPGR
jgi:hypothetical protein